MMAYEPREMNGSLFRNDRKKKDTHADYRGSALIGGVDHWMDAWINEDRNGNKYMAVKFKVKDGGSAQTPARAAPKSQAFDADLNDSIPF